MCLIFSWKNLLKIPFVRLNVLSHFQAICKP